MAGNLAEKNDQAEERPSRWAHLQQGGANPSRGLSEAANARGSRFVTIAIVGVIFALVAFAAVGVHQLSLMPRERAQRGYNYAERVWYGLKMYSRMLSLRLMVEPDPFPNTKLPVFELSVGSEAVDSLNASLPESGTVRQTGALLSFGGASHPAEVWYSGISVNHWGMPWKSWGVRMLDGGTWNGMPGLTLMMPRDETQFENWLGNEIARRMGNILTPDSEFVHFRLNGELNGVRLLTEPVNIPFMKRRNLPLGKLFHGDITTAQIYSGVPREKLFSEKEGWEVTSPFPEDTGKDEIQSLINVVQRLRNPYDFFYNLNEVMETDSLVRYMAMLELVSSVHIDETHNWKMYFNPETKRFSPIVWNSVAYYWKNTKSIDLAPNDLFRVVLSNPGLRELKDRYLWDSMQGVVSEAELHKLVTSEVERIKPDLYASFLKWGAGDRGIRLLSNAEWDESMRQLLDVISQRHAYLREQLRPTSARYRLLPLGSGQSVAVQVASRSGIRLNRIVLEVTPPRAGVRVSLQRRGIEDLKQPVRPDREVITGLSDAKGHVSLEVNDTLTSKRRILRQKAAEVVPATYVYELMTPRGTDVQRVVELEAENSITREAYAPLEDVTLDVPASHTPNIVWWEPREFISSLEK